MDINKLTDKQIAYILHRYYPEHADELTALDWKVYLILTNRICGCNYLPPEGRKENEKIKELVNLYYSDWEWKS